MLAANLHARGSADDSWQAWPATGHDTGALFGAQRQQSISAEQALDDALDVVQRGAQSSAASAVNKLAVRLAAGNDRLAQLVRKDQDLATAAETLDKTIIAAVSKEPSKRDAAAEQRSRDRLVAVSTERATLRKVFANEFPGYAALSNPSPLTANEIQSSGGAAGVLTMHAYPAFRGPFALIGEGAAR